ncbi:MAG TPA: hypothetical protein VMP12_04715 [Candidatus Sulfotelmatobacter sp.]|nr:hypothetical protein [Candidatus Sulfotelmatobacter sp.]
MPRVATKKPRASHVYPAHHAAHLIPDQLIPWLLAALLLFGLAMLTLALTARAESASFEKISGAGAGVLAQLPANANDFARDFFHHEVEAQTQDHSLWSFRETKREDGKLKLYDVCQTRQGEIEKLIAIGGRPLTADQLVKEDSRIQSVISDPSQVRQRQKKQRDDGEQARKLLRMFPDAFQFRYDGTEGSLVRLQFSPKPKFRPPDHAAQVFHHMQGTVLVDAEQRRLATIDGRLTSEVKFFGGLFGHLEKGGTFNVEQKEVAPQFWEVSVLHVHMSGKALLFKTIDVEEDETYSDFKPVPPDTSLEQAAQRLKNTPTESAQALAVN